MSDYPSIGELLKSGKIKFDGFALLAFMIEESEMLERTLKIKTHSRLLSIQTGISRKRVAYLLGKFSVRGWISFGQKKGSTDPYYILLYVTSRGSELDRASQEIGQRTDSDSKTNLAQDLRYKDLDLSSDQVLKERSDPPKPPLIENGTPSAPPASEDDQDDSSNPEREKTELEKQMEQIKQVQDALTETFNIKKTPAEMVVRKEIQEYGGDIKPLITACEGLRKKYKGKKVMDHPTPKAIFKYIRTVVENNTGAVKRVMAQTYSPDPNIDKLEKDLLYANQFRTRWDEIYPILELLSEKLSEPIEKLYADREFLEAGKLEEFKSIYEKASGLDKQAKFAFLYDEES